MKYNCPSCNEELIKRDGKFGKFLFCPNQTRCKQKTIPMPDITNGEVNYKSGNSVSETFGTNTTLYGNIDVCGNKIPDRVDDIGDPTMEEFDWDRPC